MPRNSYKELWFLTTLNCCTRCPEKVQRYLNKKKNKYEVDQYFMIPNEGKIYVEGHFDSEAMKKKLSRKLCESVWIQSVESSPNRSVNRPVPEEERTPPKVKKSMKRTSSDDDEEVYKYNSDLTYYEGNSSCSNIESVNSYNYNGVIYNYGLDREVERLNYGGGVDDDDAPFSRLGLTVGRGSSNSSYDDSAASGGGGYSDSGNVGSYYNYGYSDGGGGHEQSDTCSIM